MIFGNIGKMGEMLKQAKQLRDELAKAKYEAEAGGVRVVVNGELEIVELKLSPDIPMGKVESLVKEAVNRVLKNAKSDMSQKLGRITGGLSLPGLA